MKKILLVATGGTIASRLGESGLTPQISPEEMLAFVPAAQSICDVEMVRPLNLDSTNIRPEHWLKMASVIEKAYEGYDGFVVCHGTDTLAYTAAALSYLIQGSGKPIVLTGAQRPIDADSTDAKINLLDSLRCACSGLSGVSLVFDGHVIAGTRARKIRTKSYNAFSSINFPDLAVVNGGRIIRYIPCGETGSLRFYHTLNTNVFLLKLIPGMPAEVLEKAGGLCDGLIIESYGVGGIPDVCLEVLERLIGNGKTIVMATQVPQEGSDLSVYQVGAVLKERYQLLESKDMTLEATVTKLMWVLGQTDDASEIRRLFQTPIHYDLLF